MHSRPSAKPRQLPVIHSELKGLTLRASKQQREVDIHLLRRFGVREDSIQRHCTLCLA